MNLKDLKKLFQKQGDEEKNSYLSDKKNRANLFIAFLVGILILISISFFKTSNTQISAQDKNNTKPAKEQQKTEEQNIDQEQYESEVQDKLKGTLEKIEGVGKVDVMVSFESGEEQVPAVNVSDSTNTTEEKDNEGGVRNSTQKNNGSTVVITNDGSKSKPLIVKTYKPKVSGVCVVAEGSENKLTELRITKAVVNLFNISEDKVNVYPMKK
ncbi:stage III sporulation protein AG [Clostridium carboxidivorans P7]|uniref:Stage III sporulation protein AG n=1 Tax=Clostridium carboxidivorans P7 TaxID=536227 RepID=C6PQS0_9CLOT|nr:stage III sporulation protein AG [Clostridium carboxidivorans]AKN34025.1 stage III sporulation protein AG [Clostridium carboxidivorans P7]EET88442.1 stage III sporulation protein AG [Clostridium carboxidivorans P7]EFG88102.1 stage III sporulation protein AG [Clostridium carboxidivorans P7]